MINELHQMTNCFRKSSLVEQFFGQMLLILRSNSKLLDLLSLKIRGSIKKIAYFLFACKSNNKYNLKFTYFSKILNSNLNKNIQFNIR
jgi:hypothetical protein